MDEGQDKAGPPWRRAVAVWLALCAVLAATVAGAWLAPASLKLPLALALATLKGGLVVTVFMELTAARSSSRFAVLVGALFVALLFALSFADQLTRQDMPSGFAALPGQTAPASSR